MKGVIMLSGGGKSTNKEFAVIQATYPVGSICTATNGQKTLTAPDTSGAALFTIPEPKALPETWTVTATDPTDATKTKSKSVEITTEGQVESVTLSYIFYLIQNGVVLPEIGTISGSSTKDGAVYMENSSTSGYINTKSFTGTNEVSSSGYNTLKLSAKGHSELYCPITMYFGAASIVVLEYKTVDNYTEYSLDISAVSSGKLRFDIAARNEANYLYAKDLWLE